MILLVMLFAMTSHAQYRDHRGRGVDSLEVVASRWTDEVVHGATQEEAREIAGVWDDLMNGFLQLNPQKSYYYASRLLEMSLERGFHYKAKLASQVLGQHY